MYVLSVHLCMATINVCFWVTSQFAPTSTRPTKFSQVGLHPTNLPILPYRNCCCLFIRVPGSNR